MLVRIAGILLMCTLVWLWVFDSNSSVTPLEIYQPEIAVAAPTESTSGNTWKITVGVGSFAGAVREFMRRNRQRKNVKPPPPRAL